MRTYEDLTPAHFREWGVDWNPEQFVGIAMREGDELRALGFVRWDEDGHAWAMFDAKPPCPAAVHKRALKMIGALKQAGVTEIYAEVDPSRPEAMGWIKHFGFEPVENVTGQMFGVWRKWLS